MQFNPIIIFTITIIIIVRQRDRQRDRQTGKQTEKMFGEGGGGRGGGGGGGGGRGARSALAHFRSRPEKVIEVDLHLLQRVCTVAFCNNVAICNTCRNLS